MFGESDQLRCVIGIPGTGAFPTGVLGAQRNQESIQFIHLVTARRDRFGVGFAVLGESVDESVGQYARKAFQQQPGPLLAGVDPEAHAEAELCVVLEQRVVPGGSASVRIGRVRGGGEVAPVDG